MPGQLAQKIRAKYPGVYDDLDDAALEKAVLAKHPEYADLAEPEQKAAERPQHPYATVGRGLLDVVKNHPVATAATVGGLITAPFTAGASLPVAAAMTGLGATAGAGTAIAGRQIATGTPEPAADTVQTMLSEGALGATGPVVGGILRAGGRGLYRVGALPIMKVFGKYGDVIKEGVDEGILATKAGLEKIKRIKGERIAEKKTAVDTAGQRASFSATGVADEARRALAPKVAALTKAGEIPAGTTFDTPLTRFASQSPQGMTPTELEAVKSTLDDRLGPAYRKLKMREPLTPREESRMALSQAASRGQESVVPGYRAMNRGIMNASGVEQMIARRTVGGGANQGLENALTAAIGPAAIPARIAMLPPVMTGLGIAADRTGRALNPTAPALLRALIAALGLNGQDEP